VLITEALTRTDFPPPTDTIELHNPTDQSADISGWWLTDDFNSPAKFRIPNGTILPANGHITFDESQINPGGTGFGLSSDGDEVWLFSADAAGGLTGYVHGHSFGAAEDGVSFGRHVTSVGQVHFVSQASRSLGASNTGPRVGPVVINEIMYRPPDIGGTNDNSDDEYIELLNITGLPVPLFDGASTWRLRGGVDFDFPAGLTLAGGEFLLLVNFNPADAALASTFRAKYGVGAGVRLFGPWSGKLDNSGEDVELKKPTTPVLGVVPYVLMDKVDYRDSAPWPAGADGLGLSLQRIDPSAYGNDPTNWVAVGPTAAHPYVPGGTPPTIVTQPANVQGVAGRSVSFSVAVAGTAPFSYLWRFNGTYNVGTGPVLTLANLQPSDAGAYSVVVFNSAGSVQSADAQLSVVHPPSVLVQPTNRAVRIRPDPNSAPTTNVTFTASGFSANSAVRYQWRFNGADIPGATGTSLTVTDVRLENEGIYSCAISDTVDTVETAGARLTPWIAPSVVQPPVNQAIAEGGDFTTSVEIIGHPPPFGYSWRRGSIVIGSNSTTLRRSFFTTNTTAAGLILTNNILSSNYLMRLVVFNDANTSPGLLINFTNTILADLDRDGIPDVTENALGMDANNPADATGDLDSDGQSNRAEYLAGTDPTNAASYLKIDSISAGGSAMITFGTAAGKSYTIQHAARPTGLWTKLVDLPARTTNRVETVIDPGYTTNRFYRLATPRQP
jgi:hypothetical protein